MRRALVLYSGSLASTVAAGLVAASPGWEIDLLYVRTPFSSPPEAARAIAREAFPDAAFRSCGVKRDYLSLDRVVAAGWSFPCGACRYLLLRKAARFLRRKRYELLVTGEIVGRGGLGARDLVRLDRALGLEGRVFRPLSARLLPHVPAGDGLPRLGLRGDSPPELVELAADLGLGTERWGDGEPCPLRDEGFAARVRRFLGRGAVSLNTLQLLQFPHIFATDEFILVAALSPEEQGALHSFFLPTDVRLYIPVPNSPLGLVRFRDPASLSPEEARGLLELCGGILAALGGYGPGEVKVFCRPESARAGEYLFVRPPAAEYLDRLSLPRLNSEVKLVYLD